jgi:uncharacterized glyoxalase superfamily protein PhnB
MSDRFHHLYIQSGKFDAMVAFYRDTLGWEVTEQWGGNGEPRGSILSAGGMKVVLAEPHPGDEQLGRPTVHLDIHNLDARFAALPAGTHVVTPPEDTHWGTRWFVVRDPEGNLIAFEQVHGR